MAMPEIKLRAWLPGIKKMTYPHTLEELMNWNTQPEDKGTAIWLQYTGLRDRNSKEIYEGDVVKFFDSRGCEWSAPVTFEDGVFTVSILNTRQIRNPDGWDRPHNWIDSRHWSSKVGYGEFGTWNCHRQSLASIAGHFKDFETAYRPLCEKHGWGNRYLPVEVLGNIYEHPYLIGGESDADPRPEADPPAEAGDRSG